MICKCGHLRGWHAIGVAKCLHESCGCEEFISDDTVVRPLTGGRVAWKGHIWIPMRGGSGMR